MSDSYANENRKIGRLVAEPRLGETGKGTKVCNFRILVVRYYKKDGDPNWYHSIEGGFNVARFGPEAEELCKLLGKGDLVEVVGADRQGLRPLTNKDKSPVTWASGKPVKVESRFISAFKVVLLQKKGASRASQGQASGAQTGQPAAGAVAGTPQSDGASAGGDVPPAAQPATAASADGADPEAQPPGPAEVDEPVVSQFDDAHVPATPGARKLAAEQGKDLRKIKPTGRLKKGDVVPQITQKDVNDAPAESDSQEQTPNSEEPPATPASGVEPGDPVPGDGGAAAGAEPQAAGAVPPQAADATGDTPEAEATEPQPAGPVEPQAETPAGDAPEAEDATGGSQTEATGEEPAAEATEPKSEGPVEPQAEATGEEPEAEGPFGGEEFPEDEELLKAIEEVDLSEVDPTYLGSDAEDA